MERRRLTRSHCVRSVPGRLPLNPTPPQNPQPKPNLKTMGSILGSTLSHSFFAVLEGMVANTHQLP